MKEKPYPGLQSKRRPLLDSAVLFFKSAPKCHCRKALHLLGADMPGSRSMRTFRELSQASSTQRPSLITAQGKGQCSALFRSQEEKIGSLRKCYSEVPQKKQEVKNTWVYTEGTVTSATSSTHLDPNHLAKHISSPNQHVAKQLHALICQLTAPVQLCFWCRAA